MIGGGTAGSSAALEATALGAEVTVVERSDAPDPPWRSWPDLTGSIARHPFPRSARVAGRHPKVKTVTGEASSATRGVLILSGGRAIHYDSLIVATGSIFEPQSFRGIRLPGVFLLDSPRGYAGLGESLPSACSAVVAGEGSRGIEVAERSAGRGRRVRVLTSHWHGGEPSPPVMGVLSSEAQRRGITITKGSVERALGRGSLEAVAAAGEVIACDTLAVVPRRIPRVIPTMAALGRSGGLLVGRDMRTTHPSVYAAGGCAELAAGTALSRVLDFEAALSGRIAGSNCTGGRHELGLVMSNQVMVFGLRWTRAGVDALSSRVAGLEVGSVGRRWSQTSACSIFFERPGGRVLGIDSIEPAEAPPPGALSIASGLSLRSLAYVGLGSSDISVVSDTARLGLAGCQRC